MPIYLSLFLLLPIIPQAFSQEPGCLPQIDFFIGEWSLVTMDMQRDGSFLEGEALSSAYYILDGKAIQDDFRSLNDNGRVVFRGTSIRSCIEGTSRYLIAWIMPGKEAYTDLKATWKDGILTGDGQGYDDLGGFRERFIYFNITDSSYSFRMHRSYDGGKTWLYNFSQIEAKKETLINK